MSLRSMGVWNSRPRAKPSRDTAGAVLLPGRDELWVSAFLGCLPSCSLEKTGRQFRPVVSDLQAVRVPRTRPIWLFDHEETYHRQHAAIRRLGRAAYLKEAST